MTEICPVCNNPIEDGAAVCPSCGYKMMGSTQSFSPVNVDAAGIAKPNRRPKCAVFKIVRGHQTGVELQIKEGPLKIGRDPRCDIFLNDMTVSRDHATVEITDDGTVITDDNSFNGVWVNSKSVEQRVLADGDIVQIGEFCLLYQERC